LSDEINHIEREKRETRNMEKTMRALRQERDALKDELNAVKQGGRDFEDQASVAESYWMTPDTPRSVASNYSRDDAAPFSNDDGETFMFNDSAVIVSSSPDFRGRSHNPPVTGSLLLSDEPQTPIRATQAQTSVNTKTSDIHSLTLDLEAARQEKNNLFNACRSRISGFNDPTISSLLRQSSPPSDFFENIVGVLENALSRASDAAKTLEGITQECSNLGFSGDGVDDVISDMRIHFRSARLELEHALPGETANVSLADGKETLGALVRRVKSLAQDLGTERHYHHGSLGREKALRGQFDALLNRYEAAAKRIDTLEDTIASSAGDMLHTRMRMQDLEREGQEQAVGIDRLNTALDKYHHEVKGLEGLIDNLEKENTATKEDYTRQISKLKKEVDYERSKRCSAEATASESESRIRELEETVEQNRIRACDLRAQVEAFEKEYQRVVETLEKSASELQTHEAETGTLNVRISDLTTSLHGAKCEMRRLHDHNTGLEEQLQIEVEARNELLDKWAADQVRSFAHMKETINSERRRAKVRAANWELKSDDLMSDGTTIGSASEPITPVSARFVDFEVGRGKDRRRMNTEEPENDILDVGSGIESHINIHVPASDSA
jgi:predicted  nucleic acid-binding Zn-ribbon protein